MLNKGKEENKKLGLFDVFSIGLGGSIGSGIFVLLGLGIEATGSSIVLALLAGVIIMMCAYMYNIVIASLFSLKGGDYSQKKLLLGPMMTGVSGIFAIIPGIILSIYSIAIVNYIISIIPSAKPYTKLIAITIITILFIISAKKSKFIAKIQSILILLLMVSIAVFIVVGLPQVQIENFAREDFFRQGGAGFFEAISIMGFACAGSTLTSVSMSSIAKNPKKTIPAVILLITITIGIIYSLMSFVAAGVLPYNEVAGKNLSVVAQGIFPSWMYILFIFGGPVLALTAALLSGIMTMRYPLEQIAEDGWLPEIFKKRSKHGYPWVIQLAFYSISIIPILFDFDLSFSLSLIMIPSMLICAYCNFICIKLPQRYPIQWKESLFNRLPIPLFHIVMVVGVLCDLLVAYNLLRKMNFTDVLMVFAMLVTCIVIVYSRLKKKAVSVEKLQEEKIELLHKALASN